MTDIQTDNGDYVIINDGTTNILSKMVSNKRVETNHTLTHAVDFSILDPADMPLEGELCELSYLYDYQGTNFTCIQKHNRTEHSPFDTPALWRQYRAQGLPWEQPLSTNPYQINDWVTHNVDNWKSVIKDNVWEPGVAGSENLWTLIEDI